MTRLSTAVARIAILGAFVVITASVVLAAPIRPGDGSKSNARADNGAVQVGTPPPQSAAPTLTVPTQGTPLPTTDATATPFRPIMSNGIIAPGGLTTSLEPGFDFGTPQDRPLSSPCNPSTQECG